MTPNKITKDHYIELFRSHKFNCFPIPANQKVADFRYQASKTAPNQIISELENYGIIPTAGSGNTLVDFDNKEKYRSFAEKMISDGYMMIESPHGWHLPVVDLTGIVSKIELFDYTYQDKKIIEIQGSDHYCVGTESEIIDGKTPIKYINRGTEKIWSARGMDFHKFVDAICKLCNVESRKKSSRSGYQYLRDRFLKGEVPLKGASNDYFFHAAIQCNTDGLSEEEARDKIKVIYHKWTTSEYYSGRPWDNIESKIREIYEKNQTAVKGRPKREDGIVTTTIAQRIIKERKIYSNVDTDEIFENVGGFLELINKSLIRDLLGEYPQMNQSEYNDILFKLKGYADPLPPTNKNLIVFKNGVYDRKSQQFIETEELADMGFKEYDYIKKNPLNEPVHFMKVLFADVKSTEIPRIKAGLRSIFVNYLDPKISVIYGNSGVGKSTPLLILVEILGNQYALSVELNQFLEDKFIRAKIMGMRLLVFQDLPQDWKDFTTLKTLTGEQKKTERGFMKDMITFDNKLKIWASGNYLTKIPENEKDAMYTRRLSLIHNIRTIPHKEDPTFAEKIITTEGEKIVSWIINLDDDECKYESKETIRSEWENVASPEIEYIEKNWQLSDVKSEHSVMKLVKDFQIKYQQIIPIEQMAKSLKILGYAVRSNVINNIEPKPVEFRLKKENSLD